MSAFFVVFNLGVSLAWPSVCFIPLHGFGPSKMAIFLIIDYGFLVGVSLLIVAALVIQTLYKIYLGPLLKLPGPELVAAALWC